VVVKAEAKPTVKIDSVVPYWAQPGDQVQFVVTGEQLKQVTKVTAPELFKDLGQPEINDSGTAMTFATTLVPQSAQPGEYEFVLYGGEKGDQKLASFKVAVPEMSESGFSDSVKKLHINLDVNGGLAFGASGYTALGIYEEPITVNTFGINAGLARRSSARKV